MLEQPTVKGMHVGESLRGAEDEDLTFLSQMGVEYVDALPSERSGLRNLALDKGYWDTDALIQWREHVESFDLKLAILHLMNPYKVIESTMLGTPERDRDIERICKCIEAAARVGIPALHYHLSVLRATRSPGRTFGDGILKYGRYGRGGVMTSYFDYNEVKDDPPYPKGPITAEQAWERIRYFVERVIPVADEYKVRMACHPNDVPVPPGTSYRGVVPVLNNIDGLKRFIDLHSSPYHGIVFCQGTISEMCTTPEQVYEAIRYFGSRKKIFSVHFRNIRGGFLNFEETFPDEGDIDMLKAVRTYKEVGYNGVLTCDHVPHSDLDTPWGHRTRAYCYGYIRALIQAVESEN